MEAASRRRWFNSCPSTWSCLARSDNSDDSTYQRDCRARKPIQLLLSTGVTNTTEHAVPFIHWLCSLSPWRQRHPQIIGLGCTTLTFAGIVLLGFQPSAPCTTSLDIHSFGLVVSSEASGGLVDNCNHKRGSLMFIFCSNGSNTKCACFRRK